LKAPYQRTYDSSLNSFQSYVLVILPDPNKTRYKQKNFQMTNSKAITLLLFLFISKSLISQNLIREPYIQAVWGDSATITWKTDLTAKSCAVIIKNKNTKTKHSGTLLEHEGAIINSVTIKNLKPNKKYHYQILSNNKVLAQGPEYYLISAPKKSRKFTFYALGDIGERVTKSFAAKTANSINNIKERPEFGLGLGDIIYPNGESKVYDVQLFEPFKNVFNLKYAIENPCLPQARYYKLKLLQISHLTHVC